MRGAPRLFGTKCIFKRVNECKLKKLVVQLLIIVRIRHRYQHLQRQTIWMVRVENVRSLELFSRMEDIRDTAKLQAYKLYRIKARLRKA
jgi:hypothetical protein